MLRRRALASERIGERINAMNDTTTDLDRIDEETPACEVSDEALEAAADGPAGATTMIYNPTYGCC
jgi:hypothetical protein